MPEMSNELIQEFKDSLSRTLQHQEAKNAIAIEGIQRTLVEVQLSVARIETSNKVLSAVGTASAAGVVGLLAKMLLS